MTDNEIDRERWHHGIESEQAHIPTDDATVARIAKEAAESVGGYAHPGYATYDAAWRAASAAMARRTVQGEPTAVSPRCGNYAPHPAHTYREFQDDWPCPGAGTPEVQGEPSDAAVDEAWWVAMESGELPRPRNDGTARDLFEAGYRAALRAAAATQTGENRG